MSDVRSLIVQYARKHGVDPRAALAVARGEGGIRYGAVGDQGTSFGPFQLHVGGALPRGRDAAWANSPAGLEYAIRKMAESGARGLTGAEAINAIVRRFERPADPDASVANAIERYGSQEPRSNVVPLHRATTPAEPGALSAFQDQRQGLREQMAAALIQANQRNQFATAEASPILQQLAQLHPPDTGQLPGQSPAPGARPIGKPQPPGALPPDARAMLALIAEAKRRGLQARENPYVGGVGSGHVEGSHHGQVFAGKYNGRQLGRGLDVSGGTPAELESYFDWAAGRYGKTIPELILDSRGSIFDGHRSTRPYGGHRSHVHAGL